MAETEEGGSGFQQKILNSKAFQLDSVIGRVVRKSLDTSITGKLVGMLIVSLIGFTLIAALHTFTLKKIEWRMDEIEHVSMPQYKVSQYLLRRLNGFKISLQHIAYQADEDTNVDLSKYIIDNFQRIDDMKRMLITLKIGGTVQDVAKISQEILDTFAISPIDPVSPLVKKIDLILSELTNLSQSFQLYSDAVVKKIDDDARDDALEDVTASLEELHRLGTSLAIMINQQHNSMIRKSGEIISRSQYNSLIISSIVAGILSVGTFLYILIIVVPLKNILNKVKEIAKGEGDLSQRIEVRSLDEVGQLAKHLNILVDNIYSLNFFKAIIEEEESTIDVYRRLANLLVKRYHFKDVFIYERQSNKTSMSVAFANNPEFICDMEVLDNCNLCRAKRTGHDITSLHCVDICKKFPFRETKEHYCIPMVAGGNVIGVVQLLYDKSESLQDLNIFEEKVKRVNRYIKEATPVIEAKRFAAVLQETTLKDPMTNLYNRRFLETYVDTLVANTLRRNTKVGILMCDMDFFKEVNDTYGHETGDVVIIKTAEVLNSCIRTSDMVIRYGGEEFLVLLIDVNQRQNVADIAEKIRVTMENTVIKIPDGSLKKTLSIGYSVFPEDSKEFWKSIKYADVALYRAKEGGRNRTVNFTEDMWESETY